MNVSTSFKCVKIGFKASELLQWPTYSPNRSITIRHLEYENDVKHLRKKMKKKMQFSRRGGERFANSNFEVDIVEQKVNKNH